MIRNYFNIFIRTVLRHPGYTASNLSSLVVGMTTCILIMLFVKYEMNWNTYNKNYSRAYRVQQKVIYKDEIQIDGQTGYQLASELKKQIPEIESSAVAGYIQGEYLSTSDRLTFKEKGGCYADNNIFKVLTYEFLQGDRETALSEPFSVVITKEIANKYFPGENPFGRIIKASKNISFKVTGVIKDLPYNLDFRPDYIVSMLTYREVASWKDYDKTENIGASIFFTFVTLKPNVSVASVNDKIYNFSNNYVVNNYKKLYLKPLSELHLTANERHDNEIAVYYVGAFAIFVLILACVNFINLSTANSYLRKKEIGIRKVVGASRISLFSQFIGESIFFSCIAMLIAFVLAIVLLPYFNVIVERNIDVHYISDFKFISMMFSVFLVTGFLSGIYPALYLSGFQPTHILKGNLSVFKHSQKGTSKSYLRKSLVTFQFCISVLLLIGTIYVIKQVHYMRMKELGFVKEDLLVCRVYGSVNEGRFETLKNELMSNSHIINATVSDNAPFHGSWGKEINWEGANVNDKMGIKYNEVSYEFIDTYRMKVILGRDFSKLYSTDDRACLINETAWKSLKWENPLGQKIDNNNYTIIGIVKDFHPYSVHEKIPPFYMVLKSNAIKNGDVYSIRITPVDRERTVDFVRQEFRNFFPDAIVEVSTFDNKLDIGTEGTWEIVEKLFIGFAIIAILIAANGLFGMVSFTSQRRLKEIGVRKVFGASNSQLYILMSKEFIFILLFSALIVFPSGIVLSQTTPGAYKYQLQFIDYFFAIGLMLMTAIAAMAYHTTKAILSNPVETLRYE